MPVVGAGVARVANEPLQLGPYSIPKNTIVWVPITALQTSPALWDKADDFIPVRPLSRSLLKIYQAKSFTNWPTFLVSVMVYIVACALYADQTQFFYVGGY